MFRETNFEANWGKNGWKNKYIQLGDISCEEDLTAERLHSWIIDKPILIGKPCYFSILDTP